MPLVKKALWFLVAGLGAGALGYVATARGEPINAVWVIAAAVCVTSSGIGSTAGSSPTASWNLNDARATPAERLEDGRDFVPTNKWVLFGHHFAAIAGPGPLVGRCSPRSSAICPERSGS